MQKTEKILDLGEYRLRLYPEETAAHYASLSPYEGEDLLRRFFCYLLPKAEAESLNFLKDMGIDPEKLSFARPLSEPDENGEILFLCCARICGEVLAGGETVPRQSTEAAGMSMVFVAQADAMSPGPEDAPAPQTEMRFVIPLQFDPSFFGESETK